MEFLDLADEYEEEAYGDIIGLQICAQGDCRDPRRGPFITFNGEPICWPCFQQYELGMDPSDIEEGRPDVTCWEGSHQEDYGAER